MPVGARPAAAVVTTAVAAPAPAAGTHSLSPAELLRLQNLDRARLRRRLLQQFFMALTALIAIGTGAWLMMYGKANRREKLQVENLPAEIRPLLKKSKQERGDIAELAGAFSRLADECEVAIGKAGIAKGAIAADYKERWRALEGARKVMDARLPVRDRPLVSRLGVGSRHLEAYLDSFLGWKPDESGTQLREAKNSFAAIADEADVP